VLLKDSAPPARRILTVSLTAMLATLACIPSDPVVRRGRTTAPPPDALAEPDVDLPENIGGLVEVMSIALGDVADWVSYAKQDRDTIRLACLTEKQQAMSAIYASAQKDQKDAAAPDVPVEFVSYKTHYLAKQARLLLSYKARARGCVNAKLLMTDPNIGAMGEKEEIQRRSIPAP
jgi:hypothetical protein